MPKNYNTIEEAIDACLEKGPEVCAGIYDNKCDQEGIQYGSCCTGFPLCDAS